MNARTWLGMALVCLAGSALAQDRWPSFGEVEDHGQELADGELAALLENKTGLISFSAGSGTFGTLFACDGEESDVIEFDSGFSRLRTKSCDISGSTICLGRLQDRLECFGVRRLDPHGPLFLVASESDLAAGDATEDAIAEYRTHPSEMLGILPTPVRSLAQPEGEIDLGPMAFTIPQGSGFTLREASSYPLGVSLGQELYGGFRVITEIIGWPEGFSPPEGGRVPLPGEHDMARARITDWEQGYENRDLGEVMGSRHEQTRYVATPLDLADGPCIRIREDIGVVQSGEGVTIKPDLTVYFRQICVFPARGALFMVTTALNDPDSQAKLAAFETLSVSILDSLRPGGAPRQ